MRRVGTDIPGNLSVPQSVFKGENTGVPRSLVDWLSYCITTSLSPLGETLTDEKSRNLSKPRGQPFGLDAYTRGGAQGSLNGTSPTSLNLCSTGDG